MTAIPGTATQRVSALAGAVGDRTIRRSKAARPGYYQREIIRLLRLHIPAGVHVLQVACGRADLLAGVCPERGVGVDTAAPLSAAREAHPHLRLVESAPDAFDLDETFDFVILGDSLGEVTDVQACLECVRRVCCPDTRLFIFYHSALWEPVLRLASWLGLRARQRDQNWLNTADLQNLLDLSGFDVVKRSREVLSPVPLPPVSTVLNRVLARIWPTRHLALVQMLIARPSPRGQREPGLTCSVIIPTRNERGNVEAAVRRTPQMGAHTEIIFVDGDSSDGTAEEIERVIAAHPERDVRFIDQGHGRGKGDAVRKGFAAARGDVLMILDADLTVPPEDLPKFFDAVAGGKGEFVNGTRLVYPMERDAMRTLNQAANWFFSVLFTWLLGQRFRDTLCGTKVLRRRHYERIAADRGYFGEFDPFGDFDLIFGASKANLKIIEIPIRYKARTYGSTNISRFLHGLLLLRMSWVALWKLKLR
ncbi:MAG: glycosyltransferase [Phycisphaerales bacterium]|nr:MAG: glycosyltransferase [Phycisphaerales bacterium]